MTAIALCSGLVLGLAWGCSAGSSKDSVSGGPGSGGATDASNQGDSVIKLDGDMNDSGGHKLNPLCGVAANGCLPDEREACLDFHPPGAGGEAGATSLGEAGSGGEAGISSDAGIDNNPAFGCQVSASQSGDNPVSACAPSGHGGVDAPCTSSADCQAHLACVTSVAGSNGASNIPLCRPFCCQGDGVCGSSTYCAERTLHDDRMASLVPDAGAGAKVPVCVPGDDCDLATPYPCPNGMDCFCKGGTACMVVRSGTTACVAPGKGQELEACPCAYGYVCSADTNTCLKLCLVGGEQGCGQGLCQSVAGLPQGWGVCIGDTQPG